MATESTEEPEEGLARSAGGLRVRVARPADAAALLAIYAPFVRASAASFEEVVPSEAEMARRVAETLRTHPWLVAEATGEHASALAGYAYATPHRARAAYRWSCEVSVYVAPEHHRRGVGRALYGRLLALLAEQGFVNAYAGITLPNPASVTLHEALGFRPLGTFAGVGFKHGRWHDVGWWSRELAPRGAAPAEPVPFAALGPPRDERA